MKLFSFGLFAIVILLAAVMVIVAVVLLILRSRRSHTEGASPQPANNRGQIKSCPQCERTYSDLSLSFCLADGSLLSKPMNAGFEGSVRANHLRATQPSPPSGKTNSTRTEILNVPATPAETAQALQSTIVALPPRVPPLHSREASDEPADGALEN